jgi:2-oxopent-4-enoate/cis-2-oxohex-4-enoate hydratase
MNDDVLIHQLGDELHQALQRREPIEPLSRRYPQLGIAEAYAIQQRMIGHRLAAGERLVGKKIGVTSQAVMTMLGVDQPDFGHMLDGMAYGEGAVIEAASLIQPKAEGEIAFVLKHDLVGPGKIGRAHV